MKVLVTGATGFTGQRVVRELVTDGHEVAGFVRTTSDRSVLDGLNVEFRTGDLDDPDSLREALADREALLNTASIGFGHGPEIVAACEGAGIRRAVFFSTTAIFTALPAPSREVRLAAEAAIRRSTLDWTILRPTMIYGAPGDRNVERLLRWVARRPAVPVVGRGEKKVQPVLVDDLARAAARALVTPASIRRAYSLPGREPVSFRDFVRAAARASGRKVLVVPVPAALAVAGARILEAVSSRPRIRAEQVLRLLEDKDFDREDAGRDFGYDPAGVEDGLRLEVERLGL